MYLNFGREPEIPKALYRRDGTDETDSETIDDQDAPRRLHAYSGNLKTLQEIYELVMVHLARAQTNQSYYYNLRRWEWKCHLGDRSTGKAVYAKLAPKYSVPYTVIKIHSPVVYDKQSDNGK